MKKIVYNNASFIQMILWRMEQVLQHRLYCRMANETISLFLERVDKNLHHLGLLCYPHRLNEKKREVVIDPKGININNIFINGTYENPLWFNDIRSVLMEEIVPKQERLECNAELYKIIENNNSICVSVRRGDFLAEKNKNCFSVCGVAYFRRAIVYMRNNISNPIFIAFSDDIEWVKNSGLFANEDMVYYESGTDPVWEKLRMMYSCKHYVISNSTFSWWAQYLSRNEDKIVVAPDHWFGKDVYWPLLMDNFVKIPTQ